MISNHMIIRRRLNASSASDGDDGEEDFLVLVLSFVIVICVVIFYIRKLEFLIRGFLFRDVITVLLYKCKSSGNMYSQYLIFVSFTFAHFKFKFYLSL